MLQRCDYSWGPEDDGKQADGPGVLAQVCISSDHVILCMYVCCVCVCVRAPVSVCLSVSVCMCLCCICLCLRMYIHTIIMLSCVSLYVM